MGATRLIPLVVVLGVAGCGGGGSGDTASKLPGPANAPGKQVIADNNCLSCHQLGSEGSATPGGDLTKIGTSASAQTIRQALIAPPSGMPNYSQISAKDREAVVAYLSGLR